MKGIKQVYKDTILSHAMHSVVHTYMEYMISTVFELSVDDVTFDITGYDTDYEGSVVYRSPDKNILGLRTKFLDRRKRIPWFYKATSKNDGNNFYGTTDRIPLAQGLVSKISVTVLFRALSLSISYKLTDIEVSFGGEVHLFPTVDDLVRYLSV